MAGLGLGRGDEVIVPSFTFVSTATCVLRQGATPVFADVRARDLNIDPADVARRITRRTKAVIVVHYAGVPCDMDAIRAATAGRGIRVVEDAAHAVGGTYGRTPMGLLGEAGCFSFHATKNVTCGEGGALVTGSDEVARRAELYREKGTNRAAFLRGETDRYTWVSDGSSFVLSDLLAAVLAEQWKKRDEIHRKRALMHRRYMDALAGLESSGACALPSAPRRSTPAYHIFHVLLPDLKTRDRCLKSLREAGVEASFHYIPLHNSPFGRKTLGWRERLSVTENVADRILRLPLHPGLSGRDVDFVCGALSRALGRR